MSRDRIAPCLWFDTQAEEAARFYCNIFPNARVLSVSHYGEDAPMPAGTVLLVEFELDGQRMQALNGGPHATFNDAVSLSINCADQREIDYYWDALQAGGGAPVACGWLTDRYGLRWQVVPARISAIFASGDAAGIARAMVAVQGMIKLDAAAIERAFRGD